MGVHEAREGEPLRDATFSPLAHGRWRQKEPSILAGVEGRIVPAPLARLPNALTIARFVLVPVFVVLLAQSDDGQSLAAAVVFVVAALTDQVDGWLARRWHVESEFGKYADPLADRLMIDVAVVMLFLDDRLPWAALVLVVGRDLLLVLGTRVVVPRGYEFSVSLLGRVATWVLYASLTLVIATAPGTDWPLVVFWIGVGLALAAAAAYAAAVWRAVVRR
jgi:CDP-diacylglycerol--glycerol-3-phosphate 3-phosphatidyltransferase